MSSNPQSVRRQGRDLLSFVLLLCLSFALVFGFVRPVVASPSLIDGDSMEPTLEEGERVMVVKPELLVGKLERGDVVVFESVENEGKELIKRVAALPGETVSVRGDAVYVDGEPLRGADASRDLPGFSGSSNPVPPGHLYVLGDNRDASRDSRAFGPVSKDRIKGEAVVTFWPPGHARTL